MIHWAPATPKDVFIFYVISLVYVLSQKKFLGLATPFASITRPGSIFSDAQNRSYGCLNKVAAIRCVITYLPLRTTYLYSMPFPLCTSYLKKNFLGLATPFASITWPSSLLSDAQNRSYGCLNKVAAIRCVITYLHLRTTYLFSMSFHLCTSYLKKKFPGPCHALCEHYLTKLVTFRCPEEELWLFKQSCSNSMCYNGPSKWLQLLRDPSF